MSGYILLLYRWFLGEVVTIPGKVIALAFILFLFFLPLISTDPFLLRTITFSSIFALFAVSWDVLSGFTGQISLGHALFFGIAAYSSALLNKHLGFQPWVTIPIGSIAAVIVGIIACIPALRLRGFYLALVTLTFPIILSGIIFIFPDFTGGELGLYGLENLSRSKILEYYIIVSVMVCSVFVMHKLTSGKSKIVRIGVILHAIREDEITARSSGIDTTRYKVLAFAISAGFAGIAGGLYAHYIRVAGPSTLELFFSFQPIIWTIFGGMATIYGPVAGVFILYPLVELARYTEVGERMCLVGLALILILTPLFMPEGIAVWARDKIEVTCQRCKVINIFFRHHCRACRAPLHLEKEGSVNS
jgi:branched-chain amino acid transport system permease protein